LNYWIETVKRFFFPGKNALMGEKVFFFGRNEHNSDLAVMSFCYGFTEIRRLNPEYAATLEIRHRRLQQGNSVMR
jgi:hypothetical protein